MNKWISVRELMEMLGISRSGVQKVMMNAHYKKQPLVIRQSNQKKGKPAYFVLWDIENNKPAQPGEDDEQPETTPCTNLVTTDARASNGSPTSLFARSEPRTNLNLADAQADAGHHADGVDSRSSVPLKNPSLQLQKKATAVLPRKNLAVTTAPAEATEMESEQAANDLPPDFETLLHRKVEGKSSSTQRSMRHHYRKLYQETGEIPPALLVKDGRSHYSGKKSSLDGDIINRFIERVRNSADRTSNEFITRKRRRITVFKDLLEAEFNCTIEESKLRAIVRSFNLSKDYLKKDDDDTTKPPSYFEAEPVGALVMMDGVIADYFEVFVDGKWKAPTFIEFFDFGSRKLLAMHGYLSESNENSLDIFKRFLYGNRFANQNMALRPDQAGGFLNLKRPMTELNFKYSHPNGFHFIDDYARPGTPKDKAHLEASHKAFHDYEQVIINRFKDRISSVEKRNTRIGNKFETKDMHRLAISLDELNASGLIAEYMHKHNSNNHRFTHNGKTMRWKPDDYWHEYLETHETFQFKPEDIELCTCYGYEKHNAVISKKGTITFRTKLYYVEDKGLWSSYDSTDVTISLIEGKLAIFKREKGGEYIGEALVIPAPEKSAKIVSKQKDKVAKIDEKAEVARIVLLLESLEISVVKPMLDQFISDGLTLEITDELCREHAGKYSMGKGTPIGFGLFASDVKKRLKELNPSKIIPFS